MLSLRGSRQKNQSKIERIPGLSLRGFRDERDIESLLLVLEESTAFDGIPAQPDKENIETMFSYARNPNLNKDVLVVEVDEEVVGYNWIRWWPQGDGHWLYHHRGYLRPAWRDKGIGTMMLQGAETRIREVASLHSGSGNVLLGANVARTERPTSRLLLEHGYMPSGTIEEMILEAHIPAPRPYIPGGFELRPVNQADVDTIWQAQEKLLGDKGYRCLPSDGEYQAFAENAQPDLWHVAFAGKEIAGLALNRIDGETGHVHVIGVFASFRDQGVTRALLLHSVETLRAQGAQHILLETGDSHNTIISRHRAETANFRHHKTVVRYRKPLN